MDLRELCSDDLEAAWDLDRECFRTLSMPRDTFLAWARPEWFHGVFDAGELVALSGGYPFGQHFGGRVVPMGGLTSVAVAPHRRGRGLAKQVVRASAAAMLERGEVVSALYPATTHLYRQMGWEIAGACVWRRVAPGRLVGLPADDGVRVRRAQEADRQAVERCYARLAGGMDGCLARSEIWWQRVHDLVPRRGRFVVEGEGGELEGYLLYRAVDGDGQAFQLVCDDLVWTTRRAGVALWRLLGSWASMVEHVTYRTGTEDPLLWLFPEQPARVVADVRWMLRVLDPVAAVAARGVAASLDVAVPIEIADGEWPERGGRYWLRASGGSGRLEPGGPGTHALDASAFAALYAGAVAPEQLVRAGRLTGGDVASRAALGAVFAGSSPALLDEF